MDRFFKIYAENIPEFLQEFLFTPEIRRLKDVGMNCGCEYTSFKKFDGVKKYSRYTHSVSVALIIWTFTKDKKQTLAGLFHDIATPVFSHTIDFLNNAHEDQESTEENTKEIIAGSKEIMSLLDKYHITLEEVCDYHIYPIADNNSPKLSADRLEYSLSNMVNYGFENFDNAKKYYDDLVVGINEYGEEELMFQTLAIAADFIRNVIKNSKLYVSDEDRFAMQRLADIIKYGVVHHVIETSDLYQTEPYIIEKLMNDKVTKELWKEYTSYKRVEVYKKRPEGYSINVSAKKRYINPFVKGKGRISTLSDEIKEGIESIKNLDFNYWVKGVK